MTTTDTVPPPFVPGLRTVDDVVDGHKIWLLYDETDDDYRSPRPLEVMVAGEGPPAWSALRRWVDERLSQLGRAGLNREVTRTTARCARFVDVDGDAFTVDTCTASERAQRAGFDVSVLVMPL